MQGQPLILLLVGCLSPPLNTSGGGWGALPALGAKNLVIVHVDTLRADHLPFYGSARSTLPRLSARTGWLVQPNHYATSSWTEPSTASVMTGLDVHHHGLMEPSILEPANIDWTFGTWFAEQGYRVGLFSGNELVGPDKGTGVGWTDYTLDTRRVGNASALTDAALSWLDEEEGKFVLFLQPMDAHQEWFPEPPDVGTWAGLKHLPFSLSDDLAAQQAGIAAVLAEGDPSRRAALIAQIRALYDEEILGVDRAVDRLIAGLEARGLADETLVVFTADHGETLFDEDDAYGHGWSLRQELIRVPLAFYHPAMEDGVITDCISSNMDLFPTLTVALGLTPPDGLDGVAQTGAACRPYAAAAVYHFVDATQRLTNLAAASLTGKLEYDCLGGYQMAYDLQADPGATDRLDPALLPESEALAAVIEAHLDDITDVYPALYCAGVE